MSRVQPLLQKISARILRTLKKRREEGRLKVHSLEKVLKSIVVKMIIYFKYWMEELKFL